MNAHNRIEATPAREKTLREIVDDFFVGLGQGVSAYRVRESRMAEIRRLDAKSDAELKDMGLTRDRIPQYVFRDLFAA